ncbi:hypothetical protein EPN29_07010 [bacterium]|nr:MAG: hypothetical protein EPN29_07010 [bacterium]
MDALMILLALAGVAVAGALFGADSRPLDDDRPTRWWPATWPQESPDQHAADEVWARVQTVLGPVCPAPGATVRAA